MNNPLVSVIITCYNREQYIADTLHSLLNQVYTNWECILVDDGSTDNSREIITNIVGDDSRFHLIFNNHIGFPLSKNIGLDNIHGEFVIFLDSDDIAHPEWLKFLVYIQSITNAPIVVCDFDVFSKNEEIKNVSIPQLKSISIREYSFLRMGLLYSAPCMHFMWNKLIRAELYKGIRFVDQPALSDVAVMGDIFMKTNYVVQVKVPLIHYRQHPQSMGNTTQAKGGPYWQWRLNFQKEKLRKDWNRCPQLRFIIQLTLRHEVRLAQEALKDEFSKYCNIDDVMDLLRAPTAHFIEH